MTKYYQDLLKLCINAVYLYFFNETAKVPLSFHFIGKTNIPTKNVALLKHRWCDCNERVLTL